ncbi:MAG: BACON domain-containing protein, partial [Prevotellaceae bacterium]|nr:BACON domain-containing protein [Prevotellaceae bacterium]
QLTQTVYADKTTGKSSVNITTTGAWTSSIAEAPATRAAAPTWITISPSSGNAAGAYAIAITLEPNYSGADRSAVITISCAGQQIVINLTQTSKKEDGTTPVEPFIVTGSIVDIPDTVTVTHIKLMGDDREGDDEVLATAPYQNGSFTMTLPATIDNKFLETFDDAPDGVTVSAPDAKMLEDLSFDAYNGSELLGGTYLGTDNENIDVQLFYIDRDCAITGTGTDERNGETETAHYEMNLKAGWNWLYAIFNDDGSMTLTTTKPNNVTVKWFWGH